MSAVRLPVPSRASRAAKPRADATVRRRRVGLDEMRAPDGRYAPSPTGTLHLGNLRTALLAWLFARSQGARFLVRIEDLDSGRSREQFVAEQLADLRMLGLDWDGEPVRQ